MDIPTAVSSSVSRFDQHATIVTERLRLTPLQAADADELAPVLDDELLHAFIGGHPLPLADLRDRYVRLAEGPPRPDELWLNWVVRRRADAQPVGTVQATITVQNGRSTAHVAWVVGVDWQNQGFASEAARALVDWLRQHGADAVVAHIHLDHHSSAMVATRAGLEPTGAFSDGERIWHVPTDRSSNVNTRRARRLPALGRRGEGWLALQLVLIAAVLLSALVGRGWSRSYAPAAYASGGVLLALGLLLLVAAGLELGRSLTPLPAPRTDPTLSLVTSGPYALARHPMYGAGILFALGWTIVFASVVGLALTVALAVVLDLKARREELWLAERYAAHETYLQRTRHRLLPFVY